VSTPDLDRIEPAPGHRLGLRQRAAVVADAETLFARDVDLVAAGRFDGRDREAPRGRR
jgi:hypothetical protein